MNQRLPFYMTYPGMGITNWDEESLGRRDYEYMKSAYPATAKRIMPYVEEECDRMEYMGSMMYDEYPDQLQMRLMCRRIYDKVQDGEKNPGRWLEDLIQVLTFQEMLKRRGDHRRMRRKLYG